MNNVRGNNPDGDSDKQAGFTLIELLVVVVIIGILVAIAIPLYSNYKKGAENKSAASDVRNAVPVIEQCFTDNQAYPSAIAPDSSNKFYTLTGCPNGQINVSTGNTLTYTPPSPLTATTWTVAGTNSDSGKTYTYNSATATTS